MNMALLSYNAISLFVEHLDFMNTVDTSEITFQQFGQLEHEYIGYQSLTDVPRALQYAEDPKTYEVDTSLQ
jgi:phosphorylase kinase alpha/beta subunit